MGFLKKYPAGIPLSPSLLHLLKVWLLGFPAASCLRRLADEYVLVQRVMFEHDVSACDTKTQQRISKYSFNSLTSRVCLRCRLMRCSLSRAISQLKEVFNAQHGTFIAHWNCALIHIAPENCTFYFTCVCTLYRTWPPRLRPILHLLLRILSHTFFLHILLHLASTAPDNASFIAHLSKGCNIRRSLGGQVQ